MKHKAVIFDFGNVLGTFEHMKACQYLAHSCESTAQEIYDFAIRGTINSERETGKMPPEEFFRKMCAEFTFSNNLSFEKFSSIWGDIFSSNEAMEPIVQTLSQKVPIFILSNTEELHWRYIERLPTVQKYFSRPEQQILSFRVGARKPDKKIFTEGIKRSGLSPENILYLDDVREYVDTFRNMSGVGIQYNCRVDSIKKLETLL